MQQAVFIVSVVVAALFTRWMPHGPLATTAWWSTKLLVDVGLSLLLVVLCGIAAGGGLPRSPRDEHGASRGPISRRRRFGLTVLAHRQGTRRSTKQTSTPDVAA
jgi:hypothetical protein